MNALAWTAKQAQVKPRTAKPVTADQAELILEIAERTGGVTYGGLVMETGLALSTMQRYTREAIKRDLVEIERRGRKQVRWIVPKRRAQK